MERYADLTGHAPVLPEWASGFWQCKLRYRTQDELLAVAREHKRRGLPMSVIVIDYIHWTKMGEWKFDPVCWPDPAAMVRELEKLGIKVMVSVWPTVNPDSENFSELERRNLLVRTERGMNTFIRSPTRTRSTPSFPHLLDTTHPEARKFLVEQGARQIISSTASRCSGSMPLSRRWWTTIMTMFVTTRATVSKSAAFIRCAAAGVLRRHEVGGRKGNHYARPRGRLPAASVTARRSGRATSIRRGKICSSKFAPG